NFRRSHADVELRSKLIRVWHARNGPGDTRRLERHGGTSYGDLVVKNPRTFFKEPSARALVVTAAEGCNVLDLRQHSSSSYHSGISPKRKHRPTDQPVNARKELNCLRSEFQNREDPFLWLAANAPSN